MVKRYIIFVWDRWEDKMRKIRDVFKVTQVISDRTKFETHLSYPFKEDQAAVHCKKIWLREQNSLWWFLYFQTIEAEISFLLWEK